jgi:hypothetical protein
MLRSADISRKDRLVCFVPKSDIQSEYKLAQFWMKESRSVLINSACVVGIPWGSPGYDFSVPCFKSLTDLAPVVGMDIPKQALRELGDQS